MQYGAPIPKQEQLQFELRAAREAYIVVCQNFDKLAAEVYSRTHGMQASDGTQAIANLARERQAAFEKYRQALNAFVGGVLGPPRS